METESVGRGLCGEVSYGCREVAFRGAGVGLEAPFGESLGVEDGLNRSRGGRGEDFGREGGVLDVIEGETGAMRGIAGGGIRDRVKVTGGDTGLEDKVFVGLGNAAAIVDDDELPVAAGTERGGDVDVAGTGVAGVPEELEERVLDAAHPRRTTPEAFGTRKAGEAASEVSVRAFQEEYLPKSL